MCLYNSCLVYQTSCFGLPSISLSLFLCLVYTDLFSYFIAVFQRGVQLCLFLSQEYYCPITHARGWSTCMRVLNNIPPSYRHTVIIVEYKNIY